MPHIGEIQNMQIGFWSYTAGTSGSVTLSGDKRVVSITASAPTGASGTFNINDMGDITVPAGKAFTFDRIKGSLVDPTIVFTGTDSYIIEHVTNDVL